MLDFCEILNLNTDETNKFGDYIPKGHYYQFVSLINRFNRLIEKMYCSTCNHILYPVETAHFAAYNVVKFHCTNENCLNKEEVYLNHCLNGKCNSIIDSRVSKKCSNGLYICEVCGSCCSHNVSAKTRKFEKIRRWTYSPKFKTANRKKVRALSRRQNISVINVGTV